MYPKTLYVLIHVYVLLCNIGHLQAMFVHRSTGPIVYLAHIVYHLTDHLHDSRKYTDHNYSGFPWVRVHTFYFNALQLILGFFFSPRLKEMLKWFLCSHRHTL
jgi:hypothetical protein